MNRKFFWLLWLGIDLTLAMANLSVGKFGWALLWIAWAVLDTFWYQLGRKVRQS
jgi:hypothetical protein